MTESLSPEFRSELTSSLLEAIQDFFDEHLAPEERSAGTGKRGRVTDRQLQLATAVLVLEVARSDFDLRADEFRALLTSVQQILGLTEDESAAVVRFAEEEVRQSTRIHEFTRLIDESYSPEDKRNVVLFLWQVAFADAQLLAPEEYIVRKIAELLHVPLADFLAAKIEARDAFR